MDKFRRSRVYFLGFRVWGLGFRVYFCGFGESKQCCLEVLVSTSLVVHMGGTSKLCLQMGLWRTGAGE